MLDGPLMAQPSINDVMISVFKPLTDVCGRPDLLTKLRTAKLDPELLKDQIPRFKSLWKNDLDFVSLNSSDFIVRFKCNDANYIAFNIENLSQDERHAFSEFLISEGLVLARYEEAFYLYLRYLLGGQYKLKRDLRNPQTALNTIDVVDSGYDGHQIRDIMECYSEIVVWLVPEANIYGDRSLWYVATRIGSAIEHFRSPLISRELATKIALLVDIPKVPEDSIYTAMTAIHWKYIFFELYKCLEKIFYLPWQVALKRELGFSDSAAALATLCRANIEWRVKEESSIRNLFSMLEEHVFRVDFDNCSVFRGLNAQPIEKPTFGRKIYKIRNVLVHRHDHDDSTDEQLSDNDWSHLTAFMCDVVTYLYQHNHQEIDA
jgi:hypothetical protein